jgi:hypothetical protein
MPAAICTIPPRMRRPPRTTLRTASLSWGCRGLGSVKLHPWVDHVTIRSGPLLWTIQAIQGETWLPQEATRKEPCRRFERAQDGSEGEEPVLHVIERIVAPLGRRVDELRS